VQALRTYVEEAQIPDEIVQRLEDEGNGHVFTLPRLMVKRFFDI
jgi:hypothetical protein